MKHQKKNDLRSSSTKLIQKVTDISNVKQCYQTFLKNKNKKSVKRSKIITQQSQILENTNIVGIKSVII